MNMPKLGPQVSPKRPLPRSHSGLLLHILGKGAKCLSACDCPVPSVFLGPSQLAKWSTMLTTCHTTPDHPCMTYSYTLFTTFAAFYDPNDVL